MRIPPITETLMNQNLIFIEIEASTEFDHETQMGVCSLPLLREDPQ